MGQAILKAAAVVLSVLVAASYGGALHPAGDSLAVFRLPMAAMLALAVIWTDWPRRLRWPVAGACLVILGAMVWAKTARPEPGPVTVYQKNLWFGLRNVEPLARDILARAPDVVTLQEVSSRNRALMDRLRAAYPHRVFCPFTSWAGVAVLSRHPVRARHCEEGQGLAALQLDMPQGPVWAVSLHLHWPWPHGQGPQRDRLLQVIAGLEGPVVIGGDFNMVPWGYSVRAIAAAGGARRTRPVSPTFTIHDRDVPLLIDHVLAPRGGAAERLPRLGSDHYGVLGRVWLSRE
ncbi:Uncharacterized conserved protein YafD, endonuclease/exonuclease/phosphatase (EEP) superfamily [Cribrihabitans marinus]|uniref:Uncharacterized conserved protein YafD, endonuclease/exonuclease/phosphatase (EEP) superfamily n=1 Tax=Cribrihabitans marinus TaxID=1227549 RepID=A0A1H6VH34_9RHOB|nr:endonuclease/exonuclease/phosphatase family protein [Cribrihabitans marinus]GGH26313.1 hypothetical protein GCM10010973_14020 [Cribrihabitans marinus]SEI99652.1 Uncharacterized conserved protein YafD, endonuclease/exonuclease/phosphatase (EEP) superfamily [Cribrihabitans marinus]